MSELPLFFCDLPLYKIYRASQGAAPPHQNDKIHNLANIDNFDKENDNIGNCDRS